MQIATNKDGCVIYRAAQLLLLFFNFNVGYVIFYYLLYYIFVRTYVFFFKIN